MAESLKRGGCNTSVTLDHAEVIVVVSLACKDFRRAVLLSEQHVVLIELGALLHTRVAFVSAVTRATRGPNVTTS
jgi:hypothetical protein